jgi:hypothetical protein
VASRKHKYPNCPYAKCAWTIKDRSAPGSSNLFGFLTRILKTRGKDGRANCAFGFHSIAKSVVLLASLYEKGEPALPSELAGTLSLGSEAPFPK